MTIPVPNTLPPPHHQAKAFTALVSRLDINHPDPSLLKSVFAIGARLSIRERPVTDVRPLQALQSLASLGQDLSVPLIIDALVSYPYHLGILTPIVNHAISADATLVETIRTQVIPHLVTRLRLSENIGDIALAARIILSIMRSHEELLGLILSEADYVLPALKDVYAKLKHDKQSIQAKSDMLCICRNLISVMSDSATGGGKEALKRLMSDSAGPSRTVLIDGSLRRDYEAIFERKVGIQFDEIRTLRKLQDEQATDDPRVKSVLNVFPDLPPVILLRALNHSEYAPSTNGTVEEAAAPLLDAIVSGGQGLPDDLDDLRRAIKSGIPMESAPTPESASKSKITRNNIWNEEAIDVSRLRIKDDDDVPTPQIGNTIPDHLRESIMRLVQSQAEEEEEEARALREAHGEPVEDGEEETTRAIRVAEGEEDSGDESGDKILTPRPSDHLYNVDQQSKLELAYLSNPKVFDRDANTRRSDARKKLKEITKMDDAQIEGWRIMLERNPHKDAILSRHTFAPKSNYLESEGKGKGKESGGSNPGGSSTGGSSGDGRGKGRGVGGGGRGRGNKGSRGHSNAARTRGHDRKMTRMGAGV